MTSPEIRKFYFSTLLYLKLKKIIMVCLGGLTNKNENIFLCFRKKMFKNFSKTYSEKSKKHFC